jgi:hypothetical protein
MPDEMRVAGVGQQLPRIPRGDNYHVVHDISPLPNCPEVAVWLLAFSYFHLHDEASSATGTHQPFSASNQSNFHDLSLWELATGRNCGWRGLAR